MANSKSDFNLTDFDEYDPTPYGGGYNQIITYGKPLPPSDSICYPPSSTHTPTSLNGFSYGSIPSPYGTGAMVDHPKSKPQNGPSTNMPPYKEEEKEKKEEEKEQEEEKEMNPGYSNWADGLNYWGEDTFSNGYGSYGNGQGSDDYGKPLLNDGFSEVGGYDYHDQTWSGYGYGRDEDNCNYGRQIEPQDDLAGPCSSIFGYWPCLYKKYKEEMNCRQDGGEQERRQGNICRGTAEFVFGTSLYPYGERKDEDVSYPICAYEKHYQEQPYTVQVEHNERSESNLIIQDAHQRHYQEQPYFVQVEYNEQQSWFQKPKYYETYQEEKYLAAKHVSSESNLIFHHDYERHYQEQPHFRQVEYNEQHSWLPNSGYCEAYQVEEFPASKYGDDFFSESCESLYYNQ